MAADAPRSYVCTCGHLLSAHVLYRDQLSPSGPYHWGRCTLAGCACMAAVNETGTIAEAPQPEGRPGPEWAQRQRADIRAAVGRTIAAARRHGEPWVDWLDKRARGEHDHDATRSDGTPAACPAPGCDARRDQRTE